MDVRQAAVAADRKSIRHPWEHARFAVLRRLFSKYCVGNSGRDDVVMDIGCGDGFTIKSLAELYDEKTFMGVDPAITESLCEDAFEGRVQLRRSLDEADCSDAAIRTILLLDVLEHIEDDAGALEEFLADRRVNPDMIFIIFVPAFQWLFYSHDKVLSHFRRYSRGQLIDVVKAQGLDVLESGYFFSGFC